MDISIYHECKLYQGSVHFDLLLILLTNDMILLGLKVKSSVHVCITNLGLYSNNATFLTSHISGIFSLQYMHIHTSQFSIAV